MRRLIAILASGAAFAAFASGLQGPLASPIGGEFQVNTTPGTPWRPIVAVDRSSGTFLVVWGAYDGAFGGVFGRCFAADGTPTGDEFRVNASTTGYEDPAAVWAPGGGAFAVVWVQDTLDGTGVGAYGRAYRSCGVPWGDEFRLDTNTAATGFTPTATGPFFVVAWEFQRTLSARSIYARRFSITGEPASPAFRVDESPEGYRSGPRVAPAASGGFLVVWEGNDADNSGIFARPLASCGAPTGHEIQVNETTAGIQDRFSAGCGNHGDCLVTWGNRDHTYEDTSVSGRRLDASGALLGSEFRVDSGTSPYVENGAVASDDDGFFTVVWSESGAPWTVRARSYDAKGEPGPPVEMSDSGANQFSPTIAAGPGGLVASWGRNSEMPGGHGIFARRFAGAADTDGNGVADVRDVFWLINHLFCGGPPPVGSGDLNGDGAVDVADVFAFLSRLFFAPTQVGGTPGAGGPCAFSAAGVSPAGTAPGRGARRAPVGRAR